MKQYFNLVTSPIYGAGTKKYSILLWYPYKVRYFCTSRKLRTEFGFLGQEIVEKVLILDN